MPTKASVTKRQPLARCTQAASTKEPNPRSRGPNNSQCNSAAWGRPWSNSTLVRPKGKPKKLGGRRQGKLHWPGVTQTVAAGNARAIAGTGSLCSRPEAVGNTIVQTGPYNASKARRPSRTSPVGATGA